MRVRLPARHSLVCQQAVELMTDYLEGSLSRADRRRFEKHLAKCAGCTEYLAQTACPRCTSWLRAPETARTGPPPPGYQPQPEKAARGGQGPSGCSPSAVRAGMRQRAST
jgi:anti-sigma factor RsiW